MSYIERRLEDKIIKYLPRKEIISIQGVRQCGKTTLMKKIQQDLKNQGKNCYYITLDDVKALNLFIEDIDTFIELYVKPYDFLFIDEIQYAPQSGKQLKFIYDTTDTKIFVSGSSATEISIQSLKFLVGRILNFELYPFSFEEFLKAKDESLLSVYHKGLYKKEAIKIFNKHLDEFLLYGGFPGVVTASDSEEKKFLLENIYNTYMLRDIKELIDLSEDYKLHNLIKILAFQSGNLINHKEICNTTGISYLKLKDYLNILEKTYIIKLVRPFYTNKRTELSKNPKIYFYDSGFKNSCLNNFSPNITSIGSSYEEYVFSECAKHRILLKYWRSKSKAEVDFIDERSTCPIEVKVNLKTEQLSRSFFSFIEKYEPQQAYVVSREFEGRKTIGKTTVSFIPFVKLNTFLLTEP
jgi:uncharacterized protein